ncbi:hypothetical protein NDN08_000242 [Rhodosorus marinus]|uniref:Glutamyl-tRNA(Gln) amidotransferase subunit A, mitochondrial n=1 Tax=Rhodosorus marinus TaxID=101924 RepID=A0AAV8UEN8_9RHOD|nr:hypothetical protein NDN08_000242 [Rhodosorus marinus]
MIGFVNGLSIGRNGRHVVSRRGSRGAARCAMAGGDTRSALEIAEGVRSGAFSAEEVTREYLDRIVDRDSEICAFLSVDAEEALESARRIDRARENSEKLGSLAGVPVAVKDNLCIKGSSTTAGSRILENYVAPYTATAVQRLQAAGAVLIGKTNMDEYGMGSSTEKSAFTTTRNPWDTSRVSGGSSGGSAAAVAARECVIAVGSDTGGSIRQPASYCGVTGLKCTYGRVSRYGLLAYASSLDTVGPLATSAVDAALAAQIMAGVDRLDGTSLPDDVPDFVGMLQDKSGASLEGVRIGVIDEAFEGGIDDQVAEKVNDAISVLESLGAEVVRTSLPNLRVATSAYYILAPSEASANLARYDGVRYGERNEDPENMSSLYTMSRKNGLGEEVKRRIMVGTFALSTGYYDAFYLRAQKIRTVVAQDFQSAFEKDIDLLVSPVSPTPAMGVGEKADDPVSMYTQDILTIPASLAGLPAISVPCGFSSTGLPIGLQVIGSFGKEADVLRAAHAYQLNTDFHAKSPHGQDGQVGDLKEYENGEEKDPGLSSGLLEGLEVLALRVTSDVLSPNLLRMRLNEIYAPNDDVLEDILS